MALPSREDFQELQEHIGSRLDRVIQLLEAQAVPASTTANVAYDPAKVAKVLADIANLDARGLR